MSDRGGEKPRGSYGMLTRVVLAVGSLLVLLYPRRFRRRFGAAIREVHRDMAEAEYRSGRTDAVAAVRLGARVLRDASWSIPREWRHAMGGGRSDAGDERETRPGGWQAVLEDLRYATRSVARRPRFSLGVLAVMGLGIAAGTAVLSILDAYLLRGLPYAEADRLVAVRPVVPLTPLEVDDVFDPGITWDLDVFTLVDGDAPGLVRGSWVSRGYVEAFDVEPVLGRSFTEDEWTEGRSSVLLISHSLWMERYGGDPEVLGRAVPAFTSDRPEDAELFTIVGVLPDDFWHYNAYTDVMAPLPRDNPVYMGLLRSGVTAEEAARVLTARGAEKMERVPPDFAVSVVPYDERYTGSVRPTLVAFGLAVALVLLIACGNAAMLFTVRATGRVKEFGIRHAVGAGRGRLMRQVVLEGVLLASIASILGLVGGALLAGAGAAAVEARLGLGIPGGASTVGLNARVLAGVAIAGSLAAGSFGLAPLAGLSRVGAAGLATEGRGGGSSTPRPLLRTALLSGEIALSLALLIAAGLAVRSARHVVTADLGFEVADRHVVQVNVRAADYPTALARARFAERLTERVAAFTDVEGVALTLRAPFTWAFNPSPLESRATAGASPDRLPEAVGQVAGPGFFEVLDIPVLQGRVFSVEDRADTEAVVVVSRGLADRLWPGEEPLGRVLREAPDAFGGGTVDGPEDRPWLRVVGVVPDVWNSVEVGPAADYYRPFGQTPSTSMTMVVRMRPGLPFPRSALEAGLRELDPTVAIASVRSLERATREAMAPSRFLASVLTLFGGFAGVLAVLGLYGVVAFTAAQREKDVAIRVALGAGREGVVRLFVLERVPAIAMGVGMGVLGGWGLGRLLESQLVGVSPVDPVTSGLLAALMAVSAFGAVLVPAVRSARSDPMRILKE